MNQTLILYPMLTLVGWTMAMLMLVGQRRFASRLHPREFAVGESAKVPPRVSLPNRNFMNLLEVPVLFYVVALTFHVTQQVTALAVALAWAFVALRIVHSLVHITYNNVPHRLGVFALANFTLLGLFVTLLVRLA